MAAAEFTPVEPGEELIVELTNGLEVKCSALSFRQKKGLTQIIRWVSEKDNLQDPGEFYDKIQEGMDICLPGATAEQLDHFNEALAVELFGRLLADNSVSVDQAKKSV